VIADGLDAKLLARLGVERLVVDPVDFGASLRSGEALAVFSSLRSMGYGEELAVRLKNRYPREWTSPIVGIELLINLQSWNALSAPQRRMIEAVCETRSLRMLSQSLSLRAEARRVANRLEVEAAVWDAAWLASLVSEWQALLDSLVATNPDVGAVWSSIEAFSEEILEP
jgi:TRAP-type mannitol/chloroaromatic compound transport system substrate-binding protein